MRGRGFKHHCFSVRREVILPTPAEPEMDFEDEFEEEAPVVIRPEKKRKRLPGQKLLKELHRQRMKEREAKKIENLAEDLDRLEL